MGLLEAIILAVLVARMRDWSDQTLRLQFLGFVMVFCVLFNHRSERQSVVIAMCGVVIWYGGIWEPSKHAVDVNRFFPSHVAVVAV